MKKQTQIKISLLVSLLTGTANAKVNMKDASFFETWKDSSFIERTYHSRSLHRGYFGFGWCSNIEKKIEVFGKRVHLYDCQLESKKIYQLNKQVKFINNEYVFYSNKKIIKKFNRQGQLVFLKNERQTLSLSYNKKGGLQKIKDQVGRILNVDYNAERKRISKISENTKEVFYGYQRGNLSLVLLKDKGKRSKYHYKYDQLNNLIRIKYPDQTFKKMEYDLEQDMLLSLTRRDQCLETFSYRVSKKTVKEQIISHMQSVRKRKCREQLIADAAVTYEFWHSGNENTGEKYLRRSRMIKGKEIVDIEYAPEDGKILKIRRKI